ncbi:salivary cystatin-L2-like [Rhipicephalus sanguineus]|uniref:salivary cystatin-L2-like n=1 Tax=Rhipicephalus sanguineus TaxID=34632 RepID=UPI001895CBF3|nr:salivary cystatin-L2-like [Rhipicephalus sanguineus]
MAHLTGSIAVLVTALVTVSLAIPGGWSTKEPSSSPKYKELAHFAVAQRVEGLEKYDTVLELTAVETQIVAGVNYRLTFSIAATDCIIAEVEYNAKRCPPKDNQAKATCTAVVYERPWENLRSLTSLECA